MSRYTPPGFRDFMSPMSISSWRWLAAIVAIVAFALAHAPFWGLAGMGVPLGMATHAAMHAGKPVLFFSLEMSRLELSQRLLSAEARVDSRRMASGRLEDSDWTKITGAVGRLAEAPLWLDDNPNVSIAEIRGKARRLSSKVGQLGMIVVDYIQLMTGRSNAENRQVEVAEISRGLKILARELHCPVVALAQLNRGLEQRADKRPLLSDLRVRNHSAMRSVVRWVPLRWQTRLKLWLLK